MSHFLTYTVEIFEGARRRHLGDFRRLKPAVAAARRALDSPRATLAVVLEDGVTLRYAVDRRREWADSDEDRLSRVFRDVRTPEGWGVVPMP